MALLVSNSLILRFFVVNFFVSVIQGSCSIFRQEELVERLESINAAEHLKAQSDAVSSLVDSIVANEYDRISPLSVALFGSEQSGIKKTTEAAALALFGSANARGVKYINIKKLIEQNSTPSMLQQKLKAQTVSQITKCTDRTLIVLDNLQAISAEKKYVASLDFLLDALSGKRGLIGDVDSKNAIFLMIFYTSFPANITWQEYLESEWKRENAERHQFTEGAMIGRISKGIVFNKLSESEAARIDQAVIRFPGKSRTVDFIASTELYAYLYILLGAILWIGNNNEQ